jgi:hypothetical protein
MDEHRNMARELFNDWHNSAVDVDLCSSNQEVLVEMIEAKLRTTASKSEKDGYRRGVEDSAKCVRRLNNTQFGNNEHWMEAHIRSLIMEDGK